MPDGYLYSFSDVSYFTFRKLPRHYFMMYNGIWIQIMIIYHLHTY